jgi:hypothetical protein
MATTGDPKIGVPKIDAVKGTAQAEVDVTPASNRFAAAIPKLLMRLVHICLSGSLSPWDSRRGSQYRPNQAGRLSGHRSIFRMGNPSLPRRFPVRAQTREELEELAGRCRPHGRIGG